MANSGLMARSVDAHLLMLNIRVIDRGKSTFGPAFMRRLDALDQANTQALQRAAAEANRISKNKARALRPPTAPRRGRTSPPGALAANIDWSVKDGQVVLDRQKLDTKVKWWVVQEIGTNSKAVVRRGGEQAPKGRPSKASVNAPGGRNVSVRSQKGRRIPGNLAFGTGPRGQWTPPTAGRQDQQLHLMSQLKGVPLGALKSKSTAIQDLRISREIKPKGFIRQGAREGFRDYRNDVVAAARASLGKRKT